MDIYKKMVIFLENFLLKNQQKSKWKNVSETDNERIIDKN